MYEITDEVPYFMELSQHASPTAHQAISFCPKFMCNVRKVEFAIGYRLGLTDMERLSFTVPRRRVGFWPLTTFLKCKICFISVGMLPKRYLA